MQGYSQTVKIDVHDLDFNGICRASALMRYFQSAAELQLTSVGLPYAELKQRKRGFILSRITMEFSDAPRAFETVEARTFPCISRGYTFTRCYELTKNGKTIGRAISAWALVDTETRSLVAVKDFELPLELYDPSDMRIAHFRLPSDIKEVGTYTVNYADLDQNEHMNNTHYPDMYANFLDLRNMRVERMTISYQKEARFLDTLRVYHTVLDGVHYLRTVLPSGEVNSECAVTLVPIV